MAPNILMFLQLADVPAGCYKITMTGPDGTTVCQNEMALQSGVTQTASFQSMYTTATVTTETATTEMATPNTFPRFKELPAEIRRQIWALSLSEPRVFWPTEEVLSDYFVGVSVSHKPPAMRQVCLEARQVSQARGVFAFGSHGSIMKGLWFDFFSDIILMTDVSDANEYVQAIDNARNVALFWREALDLLDIQILKNFIGECPKCRRIIAITTGSCIDRFSDMKLFTIQDNETVERETEDWGTIRDKIHRAWRKESALQLLGITEAQLPRIEAMEAMSIGGKVEKFERWF
ncbi:hypothetical protein ACHAPA_007366 [Fusarium lateritium]